MKNIDEKRAKHKKTEEMVENCKDKKEQRYKEEEKNN